MTGEEGNVDVVLRALGGIDMGATGALAVITCVRDGKVQGKYVVRDGNCRGTDLRHEARTSRALEQPETNEYGHL